MKRILVIGLVTVGVVLAVFFLTVKVIDQRHVETTAFIMCNARQQTIYNALVQYRERNGVLPSELSVLVEGGYLKREDTYCPVDLRVSSAKPYHYCPDNFGHPESVIISDDVGSHTGKKLFAGVAVVIVTMGDGKTWCALSTEDARRHY